MVALSEPVRQNARLGSEVLFLAAYSSGNCPYGMSDLKWGVGGWWWKLSACRRVLCSVLFLKIVVYSCPSSALKMVRSRELIFSLECTRDSLMFSLLEFRYSWKTSRSASLPL